MDVEILAQGHKGFSSGAIRALRESCLGPKVEFRSELPAELQFHFLFLKLVVPLCETGREQSLFLQLHPGLSTQSLAYLRSEDQTVRPLFISLGAIGLDLSVLQMDETVFAPEAQLCPVVEQAYAVVLSPCEGKGVRRGSLERVERIQFAIQHLDVLQAVAPLAAPARPKGFFWSVSHPGQRSDTQGLAHKCSPGFL
ncbi:MAG: Uncharacterised protein [Flavobacteriia bacterium]|nr:MAG: Uncharacterised protein [Flavobacteriia bacterium]